MTWRTKLAAWLMGNPISEIPNPKSGFAISADLTTEVGWRSHGRRHDRDHADIRSLFDANDAQGRFAWALMGGTLAYAAALVPEISDDIVNVDRAMRWGFAWKQGPFEMLDALDPAAVITRLEQNHRPVPNMLAILRDAGADRFYRDEGKEFLGTDGQYHPAPAG